MAEKQTLYLIDGSSYIYRAYFAIRHLSSPGGFPTNAIYGFTQMLLKVLKERKPDHVAVVFDAGKITFRNDLYPLYKANRVAMPDDLARQIGPIKEMVRGFRIPALEMAGYEADDIIATLAAECESRGLEVVVVTGDKDLMQIVTENVRLLDTMKEKESGLDEVRERFGVAPSHVTDILGLAGDTSDNIPGVPGIGEKTAIKLISEFGSLDALLEQTDRVKGKCGERLREFREQALLSRRLATVDRSVPLVWHYEDLALDPPDNRKLGELFKEYGFTSLMKELCAGSTLTTDRYHTVLDEAALSELVKELRRAGCFALDLETTSLDPISACIVGISLSFREHEAFYVPVEHRYPGAPQQLPREVVLEAMRPLLVDPSVGKVGQNLKYDYQVLKQAGIELEGIRSDTMIASYLLNPNRSSHGLDSLAVEYLDHRMISYAEVAGSGKDQKCFSAVPVEEAARYSCEDADAAWLLHTLFLPRVRDAAMEPLFSRVEVPLVKILSEMEFTGVKLDLPLLRSLSEQFGRQLAKLEEEICRLADCRFNINSPKQLGETLFVRLGLKSGKKTKGKTAYSTDISVLESLVDQHEIIGLILQYRSISKLKSTYTDALPRLADQKTERIHCSYNQAVTSTGRLSSSEPNLQNIPVRSEDGRNIRRAFIAESGSLILSADYSQIELRVLAHLSQDPVFCDAFSRDEDIHTRTASEIFGLFPEMVTPEMRRQAKTINFGVIYGQGPFSLAKQLGIAPKTAREFIDNYFERHRGAKDFLEGCVREARERGYVTTILGRRLPIPDIGSSNGNVRSFAERNAINYPIQGSAADIIKMAMVRIFDRLRQERLHSRLIMQVHDELVLEVPEEELEQACGIVRHEMEHAVAMDVPLKVEMNWGHNWSEAH